MAWAFQGVLNAGVQILIAIAGGWFCGRLHLVDPNALSASLNTFAMKSCFPAFVIHLLGIKADLQDAAAWRWEQFCNNLAVQPYLQQHHSSARAALARCCFW
jgi:hypothetical protein